MPAVVLGAIALLYLRRAPESADRLLPAEKALLKTMLGLMASLPVCWNLPTGSYQGKAAAFAIAFITSFGNIPGFFSPYIVGWINVQIHRLSADIYS